MGWHMLDEDCKIEDKTKLWAAWGMIAYIFENECDPVVVFSMANKAKELGITSSLLWILPPDMNHGRSCRKLCDAVAELERGEHGKW